MVEKIREYYSRRSAEVAHDRYATDRLANKYAIVERDRILADALRRRGHADLGGFDILEVGCGTGAELERLVLLGADPRRLHGIDLLPAAIAAAQARLPDAHLQVGDASSMPYPDRAFDVVYQAVALSSMPTSSMRSSVAAEILRLVRPGGLIISYDFVWNPLNRATTSIDVRELRRLFPGLPMEVHRVTLAPPVGRWIGDRSVRVHRLLAAIPALRSHRLVVIDVPKH